MVPVGQLGTPKFFFGKFLVFRLCFKKLIADHISEMFDHFHQLPALKQIFNGKC